MGQDLLAQSGRATPGGRSLQRDKTLHDFRYVLVRDRCVIGILHLSDDIPPLGGGQPGLVGYHRRGMTGEAIALEHVRAGSSEPGLVGRKGDAGGAQRPMERPPVPIGSRRRKGAAACQQEHRG